MPNLLLDAIHNNNLEKVKEIITANPRLANEDISGLYTLTRACILPNYWNLYTKNKIEKDFLAKRYKIIKFLLKSGADVNKKNDDKTAFIFFITDMSRLDNLEELGDVIIKIIKLLIKFGADINAKDKFGSNVLHILLLSKCNETILKITKILIDNGLNINERNCFGKNAIDEWFDRFRRQAFRMYNAPKMIALLLEYGINLYEGEFGELIGPIMEKKDEEITKLKKEIEELRYRPGNPGYKEAAEDFDQLTNKLL